MAKHDLHQLLARAEADLRDLYAGDLEPPDAAARLDELRQRFYGATRGRPPGPLGSLVPFVEAQQGDRAAIVAGLFDLVTAELVLGYRDIELLLIAAGARWPQGDPREYLEHELSAADTTRLRIQLEYNDDVFYREQRE